VWSRAVPRLLGDRLRPRAAPDLWQDDDDDASDALFGAARALAAVLDGARENGLPSRGAAAAAEAALAGADAWPGFALPEALGAAWRRYATDPPDPRKVAQLAALARCLVAARAEDLPISAVAALFGADPSLLALDVPPPDDAAAFGDLAETAVAEAAADPDAAAALRASSAKSANARLADELRSLDAGGGAPPPPARSDFAFRPDRDGGEPEVLFDFSPKAEPEVLFDFSPKAEPEVLFDFSPKAEAPLPAPAPASPAESEDEDW
jgi:hypothetical protein